MNAGRCGFDAIIPARTSPGVRSNGICPSRGAPEGGELSVGQFREHVLGFVEGFLVAVGRAVAEGAVAVNLFILDAFDNDLGPA